MTTKSAFSVLGLAHKVFLAAEAQGYTSELLNALAEHPSLLGELRKVQLGFSEIKPIIHIIDCDANPFIPECWRGKEEGWKVEEHRKGGMLTWNPTTIKLYLSERQRGYYTAIKGDELCRELTDRPVLNANVLDYLLSHPYLIPEGWKNEDHRGNTRRIYFWGTVYRRSDDSLCVRCLCWEDGAWDWDYHRLDDEWGDDFPAACLADL